MLVPLYKRQHSKSRSSSFSKGSSLELCLKWWLDVLSMQLVQAKLFTVSQDPVVHLFADARGHPARLAAVLLVDGEVLYTDWAPPSRLLDIFERRDGNQIMGLELLAIALDFAPWEAFVLGAKS